VELHWWAGIGKEEAYGGSLGRELGRRVEWNAAEEHEGAWIDGFRCLFLIERGGGVVVGSFDEHVGERKLVLPGYFCEWRCRVLFERTWLVVRILRCASNLAK
jgi:hypothetical protein